MQAHRSPHCTTALLPEDILRAHIDQLSPAQQRDFVAIALKLLAARDMLDEVEETVYRVSPASLHTVVH